MSLTLIFLLVFMVACNPLPLGFTENLVSEAYKLISNQDSDGLTEILGKEALCVYGNDQGIAHLKEHLGLDLRYIDAKFELKSSQYYTAPQFVKYWSYYNERYLVTIAHKGTNELILQAVVDCDFGTDEEKSSALINLKSKQYPKKGCRITKIMPKNFGQLVMPDKCQMLKVSL